MKCPKCRLENPETSRFCAECGTNLIRGEEPISPESGIVSANAQTETLQAPIKELTTGSTFAGRYQIIEELGKGGMGRVYKVYDSELKEKIALKLLKPEIGVDEEMIERFRNELKLARKISQRNVCRMHDLNREEGAYYITMEYVHGEDLKRLIRKVGQMSAGKTISIAKQVCEGLAEAHSLGIVHRDLKPQNIMVDEAGNAKIMDFGIARSLKVKGITGAGVMIGTPEYMSPEQVEGKEVDQRSDIYSLGIILYEMVTGRVPFEGDTPFTIGIKHKSEVPKNPKDLNAQIPEDLSRLILRCLEKAKEKRYQSADEVHSELAKIEKGIPTTERIVPERKPFTSKEITVKFSLRKLLIPAFAVAAIIILAALAWRLIPKKKPAPAPKIENSVAVIGFENLTGDKSLDDLRKAIPNLLITSLEQSGHFYVATWERMHDLLKQMGKGDEELIGRDAGFELCRQEGIKAIVLGTFAKAGNMFATDVKVLDVETKKLLRSASSRGEGVDSILRTQIDELSREISEGIGTAVEKMAGNQLPVAEVTTSSMEAYNYFLRGKEEWDKFYYEEARNFLKKAVELDPTFAMAHRYLAWTYENLSETSARNEAIGKAMTYAQKAAEKERLYIEADYAGFIENDRVKSIRLLEQIVRLYPKEKEAYYLSGDLFRSYNLDKAIEQFSKALKLDSNYGIAINLLAWTWRAKGDFEKALELYRKYASLSPGDANPFDSMANLYFRMGRIDEAIANFKEALSVKPDFFISMIGLQYISAIRQDYAEAGRWLDHLIAQAKSPGVALEGYLLKGFYWDWLGSMEKAWSEFQKTTDLAEQLGNEEMKALISEIKAWTYYDRGELELSRNHFKNAEAFFAKNYPDNKSLKTYVSFYNGLLDAKQGRTNSAKSKLAEMRSFLSEPEVEKNYRYTYLNGEILLAEGKPKEAISLLEKAPPRILVSLSYGPMLVAYNFPFLKDTLARAYEQNREIDKAIAEYERLTAFYPKSGEPFLIHPKYHYRLGKLYEQKGLKAKAIEHYKKFLDLWKDADPEQPEVEDARKCLASLR
jgi:serine/threonine protein kinase/tetratricopeptide (TPR) repeat protein